MKRHLDCKDYERMTYESVAEKYEPESDERKVAMILMEQGWGASRLWPRGQKEVVWRELMLREVYRLESDVYATSRPLAHMIRDEPKTYRVSINDKGGVEVICFDLENIDSELEGHYDEVSALPVWVQERIAVLAVCSPNPPTPTVEGVGRRISENIYWVYK